jgi:hypothetical protein
MPPILTPEQGGSGGYTTMTQAEMGSITYKYPFNLDLRPGSEAHNKIKAEVLLRAQESYSIMSKRHSSWNSIDNMLEAYIKPDELEKKLKANDARKPVSIVVPHSFAVLETILTYLVMAFFQDPILQYDGAGPEDMVGAKLLELCVDSQMRRSQGALTLHTMFRDSIAYGIGPVVAGWKRSWGKRIVKQDVTFLSNLAKRFGLSDKTTKKSIPTLLYEGMDLQNIDPYMILPDTNYPIHKAGNSEYFGWVEERSLNSLLEEELWPESDLFNVRYLKGYPQTSSQFTVNPSKRGFKYGLNERHAHATGTNSRTLINMYVNLIPRDWKLTPSEYPEKWLFILADDTVVISARPLNLTHNSIPVVLASPDYDGYSAAPISRLETILGLQEVLNFLFNSHVANVRRAVNNMFVVDPSLVNMPDFDNPEGGLLLRIKRAQWGRGVEGAVTQLQINDVTKQNIIDAFSIMDMDQRVTGATDQMMGMMRKGGERHSATEARGTLVNAANRMERIAKITSLQAMQPLSYLVAYHTQQLMSEETYVNITGDWLEALGQEYDLSQGKVKVSPFDILVPFDVIPRDGSLPIDVSGISNSWIELYRMMSQNPSLMGGFKMVKIFMHIARLMGAKDISQFIQAGGEQKIQTMNDEQVAQEQQKGNLVPVNSLQSSEVTPTGEGGVM